MSKKLSGSDNDIIINMGERIENLEKENEELKKKADMWDRIDVELKKAIEKHPKWPKNLYKQHAIISEELGELAQAILKYEDERGNKHNIIKESKHVIVTAIRFLMANEKEIENE